MLAAEDKKLILNSNILILYQLSSLLVCYYNKLPNKKIMIKKILMWFHVSLLFTLCYSSKLLNIIKYMNMIT